jgi:hypothetical protein
MLRAGFLALTAISILTMCPLVGARVSAQQNDPAKFNQSYVSIVAKADADCKALWSDHVFDRVREKFPLLAENPTLSMLSNHERLLPKDKSLADLALKVVERCREFYAPAYAMLPPGVAEMIHGEERKQDALIAELYTRKITFGEYNIKMSRTVAETKRALSGIPQHPDPPVSASIKPENRASAPLPRPRQEQAELRQTRASNETRIALVIGNSNYSNLPKLSNPTNDARSVAETLQKMGYGTQLLLDATEDSIRKQVRKFASESGKAEVAVVYYAGHGAQLNGSNYILPIDIEIPRTDADIQFTGLKIDDLVNSIGSNTKIVFLDACRDNPVLFKNIVKGRGGSPTGLAPAIASNFDQTKPGGGIFIAYATDAGAVADDGKAAHSPFTEALLRYMQKPISIDDMFSFVTREVRLVTKNAQRPYKYASLENIVCLMPECSSLPGRTGGDIIQQAKQSQDDELQIALQTNNSDALDSYLHKYPDSSKRSEILTKIAGIKRSEFTEWTLYEIGDLHLPQFMQLSSIRRFDERAAVKTKELINPDAPNLANGKPLPDAAYIENLFVYDCTSPRMAISEQSIFNKSGEVLYHYKWADPQFLNLSIGGTLATGSVGSTARKIVCDEQLGTPLISKKQIAEAKFNSLSSTATGDGEIFYVLSPNGQGAQSERQLLFIVKLASDHSIKDVLPQNVSIPDPPNYRIEVNHMMLNCDENRFAFDRVEHWNASHELVRLQAIDPEAIKFAEFQKFSPVATLQEIVCGKGYAGVGIRWGSDNGSLRVTEVFAGSPAEKGGVKPNDVLTKIDNAAVSGLTQEQLIEKVRGPANTQVVLTLVRNGQNDPFDLTITREIIQLNPQGGPPK